MGPYIYIISGQIKKGEKYVLIFVKTAQGTIYDRKVVITR